MQGFFVVPKNRKQTLKMHFSGRIIKSVMPYRKNYPFFDKVFIDFSPAVIYNNKDMQVYMYIKKILIWQIYTICTFENGE